MTDARVVRALILTDCTIVIIAVFELAEEKGVKALTTTKML